MTETLAYCERVAAGDFSVPTKVPLDDEYENAAGVIENLVLGPVGSVSRLSCRRGSVRANHWHRTDWHYAYVESGKVLYFERAVGSSEVSEPVAFEAGEMFFTPPNREHAMLFADESIIFTFSSRRRTHEEHEADVVRVEYVTPTVVDKYLP